MQSLSFSFTLFFLSPLHLYLFFFQAPTITIAYLSLCFPHKRIESELIVHSHSQYLYISPSPTTTEFCTIGIYIWYCYRSLVFGL